MVEYAIAGGLNVAIGTAVIFYVRNYRLKPNQRTRDRHYSGRLTKIHRAVLLSLQNSP
jgi:hypothetical protein